MKQRKLSLLVALPCVASFVGPSLVHTRRQSTATTKLSMFGLDTLPSIAQEFLGTTLFTELPSALSLAHVQAAGETSLASLFLISAVQGTLIAHQYATNPSGELIVPPGRTFGVENGKTTGQENDSVLQDSLALSSSNSDEQQEENKPAERDTKHGWYHVNKMLVFLLPWMASQGSFALLRYGHLLHLAVIASMAKVYDVFQPIPDVCCCNVEAIKPMFPSNKEPHLMVLGDSMSVGIGCVDEFDEFKNSGILRRIEQLEESGGNGPVFPKVLARTLSKRFGRPVAWRSAGVDGGDTNDIREHLLGVVEEEVKAGRVPDVVVVLTGSNDLKHILSPKGASVRGFQSNLLSLVQDIRDLSPNTQVVFPALPTYRLDPDSILNVFPLTTFLDRLMGFWDAQKMHAASKCPNIVQYVGLTSDTVNQWYKAANGGSLLAADGIHPNAKCYDQWATYLGNILADRNEERQQFAILPTVEDSVAMSFC